MDDKEFAKRIVEIFQGCAHKEPDELTGLEKAAIAIAAGCEWEQTETGVRVKNPIAIRKLDGRFIVDEARD